MQPLAPAMILVGPPVIPVQRKRPLPDTARQDPRRGFRPGSRCSWGLAGGRLGWHGGRGWRPGHGRRWDVGLSFAGAQRDYVGQVAVALKKLGVRCFYDADEQVRLWGTHLAEELPRIYAQESAAVVVFISADYAGRDWTRLERRAALSRAVAQDLWRASCQCASASLPQPVGWACGTRRISLSPVVLASRRTRIRLSVPHTGYPASQCAGLYAAGDRISGAYMVGISAYPSARGSRNRRIPLVSPRSLPPGAPGDTSSTSCPYPAWIQPPSAALTYNAGGLGAHPLKRRAHARGPALTRPRRPGDGIPRRG